jgi:molecular chaperone GrpE
MTSPFGDSGKPESAVDTEEVADGVDDNVVGNDRVGVDAEPDELAVASRERDEYLDMLRRVQADFENYKKRMQRQQADLVERASENLVAKLLPALDAFDLTRAHLADGTDASPDVKALLQASDLVADALAKEGLERIDDAGSPFDPTVHDAVEHAPADTADAADAAHAPTRVGQGADDVDTDRGAGAQESVAAPVGPVVVDVLRPGYRWKGRVIRPAMVRVRG